MIFPVGTFPPILLVRSSDDLVGSEGTVFCWVPLDGQIRVEGSKRVGYGNQLPRTEGASSALGSSAINLARPLMIFAFGTAPPIFLVRTKNDPVGSEGTVCGRMPPSGDVGVERGKRVGYRRQSASTIGAATARCSVSNSDRPLVILSLGAFPPIFLTRQGDNLVRGNRPVFGRVPLGYEGGAERGEGVGYRNL